MHQPLTHRPKRQSILPVVAAAAMIAGALLVPAPATAAPEQERVERADVTVRTQADRRTPQALRAFWTPERLERAARNPADTPVVRPGAAPKAGAEAPRAKAETAPTATADAVPPDNWAPRPSSSSSISPLAVSVSQRVSNTYVQPQSAVGRIFFSNQAETEFSSCSGTSITSTTRNAVWTAAHCLHQGSGGDAGWFANHVFIPAYSNGSDPFGWYFGLSIIASNDWINDADLKDSDMGAMIVVPEDGLDLQGRVGGWGYTFGGGTAFTNARSYGYPVIGYNRPDSDFADGEYMMFCEGNIVDAANLNPLDDRLRMNCDMGGGSSGGPMATGIGTSGGPRIVGVNSHRNVNSNGNYIDNYMFSANHGSTAVSIINAVNS